MREDRRGECEDEGVLPTPFTSAVLGEGQGQVSPGFFGGLALGHSTCAESEKGEQEWGPGHGADAQSCASCDLIHCGLPRPLLCPLSPLGP